MKGVASLAWLYEDDGLDDDRAWPEAFAGLHADTTAEDINFLRESWLRLHIGFGLWSVLSLGEAAMFRSGVAFAVGHALRVIGSGDFDHDNDNAKEST